MACWIAILVTRSRAKTATATTIRNMAVRPDRPPRRSRRVSGWLVDVLLGLATDALRRMGKGLQSLRRNRVAARLADAVRALLNPTDGGLDGGAELLEV